MINGSKRAVAMALMIALVACGALVGVAMDRLYLSRSGGMSAAETRGKRQRRTRKERLDRLMRLFDKRLDLSAEQEKAVRDALAQSYREMNEIKRRIEPELKSVRKRAREKIRKVLSQKQLKIYDEMVARYEARRQKRYTN